MSISFTSVLLVVVAALGFALGYFANRAKSAQQLQLATQQQIEFRERAAQAEARAGRLLEENEALHDRAREDADVLLALGPLNAQLKQVGEHVDALQTRVAQQHSQLVTQIQREAQVNAELSRTTTALNSALRSTTARGTWGEVQLRRILELAGLLEHVDFDAQKASATVASTARKAGSSSRPDVIVHLPGEGMLAIDSKVPMNSYLSAMEIPADDLARASERAALLAQHAKAMRAHMKELVKRAYAADFPSSPQVVVMFIPSESLLAEAVQADPTFLEDALAGGIVPASPATLLAMLRAVAAVWASAAASKEAEQIVDLGVTLVDRLGVFLGHLGKLGKALGSSVTNYNAAVQSLESRLLVTARALSSLPGSSNLDQLPPITSAPRGPIAPEARGPITPEPHGQNASEPISPESGLESDG